MISDHLEERRKYPRLDVKILNISAMIRPLSGQPVEFSLRDIGLGGISFQTDMAFQPADHLELTLEFPTKPLPEKTVVEVVWTHIHNPRPSGGRILYDVGVAFIHITESCMKEINREIQRLLQKQKYQADHG